MRIECGVLASLEISTLSSTLHARHMVTAFFQLFFYAEGDSTRSIAYCFIKDLNVVNCPKSFLENSRLPYRSINIILFKDIRDILLAEISDYANKAVCFAKASINFTVFR